MSSPVHSPQNEVHRHLYTKVARHLERPFERPIATHTEEAWNHLRAILEEAPARPIVLDSGCGTGQSAHRLATVHPAAWVIAVDRSAHRLRMTAPLRRSDRIMFARAELGDLFRLMVRDRVRLGAHYLLYPNPWPKAEHLGRRWHGHPTFPHLLALGGRLEVRTNWRLYLEELAIAIRLVTGASAAPARFAPLQDLTPFEKKYRESGHSLFRLQVCLRPPSLWRVNGRN